MIDRLETSFQPRPFTFAPDWVEETAPSTGRKMAVQTRCQAIPLGASLYPLWYAGAGLSALVPLDL